MIVTLPHIIARSFSAITIYPFIFVRHERCKKDVVLINHERIHIQQQKELIWIVFFVWYIVEYLLRLIYYQNRRLAYKNISFEREAYANEYQLDYLTNRNIWAFIKYL